MRLHMSPVRSGLRFVGERLVRSARAPRHGAPAAHARLERIVEAFLAGYCAALDAREEQRVVERLERIELELRGFAYEGAAMALALLDMLLAGNPSRLRRFIDLFAAAHVYMAHVGAGWAAARLRRSPTRARRGLDPLLGWLAIDGYGFHEGFFHPERIVRRHGTPPSAGAYETRVFDQGLGRSLWFVEQADVEAVGRTVASFPAHRHADLWSGIGLAAAYAGGATASEARTLRSLATGHEAHLAQGAAFAAAARARASNPAAHTNDVCEALCGTSATDAAALVHGLREGVTDRPDVPAYAEWRHRIAAALTSERLAARR